MKLRDEIIKNFNDLDPRVIEYLDKIISEVNLNKSNTSDYTRVILEMLVVQLILYYKSSDQMISDTKVTSVDDYKRAAKNPAISVMQKANDQILILLDKINLSPMQKAKMNKLSKDDEVDAKELLEDLIN